MMSRRTTAVGAVFVIALSLVGSEAWGTERVCGPGTEEVEGECRSSLSCGEGTVEQDGICVPSQEGLLTCGAGTRLEDGVCVRLEEPVTCGENTREEDGACVSTITPVSCGEGTELDDSGESCVAISPLVCGPGTSEESGECVSAPCGEGTVEHDGLCIPIELSSSAALDGFCPKFAYNYCDSLSRCGCEEEGGPIIELLASDMAYCQAHIENKLCLNTSLLLGLATGTGQFEPNLAAMETFVGYLAADEDCVIDIPPYLLPGQVSTYLIDLLSPGAGESEPCMFTAACADPTHVCRYTDAEAEETLCLAPAGLSDFCNTSQDCESTLYCSSESDSCQPRGELSQPCSTSVPCVEGACCRENVCVAEPGESEACCDNSTCGETDALYCSGGQCVVYAQEGDSCTDISCALDLRCEDYGEGEICTSRMPFCALSE